MSQPPQPLDGPVAELRLAQGPAGLIDHGSGPALVLVHGLPGSVRDFRWLLPTLDGVRAIALDLPGFGATPTSTAADPSPTGRAAFALKALDALGIERAVWLGHSMGSTVISAAAELAPERCAGMALVSGVGLRKHRALRRARGLRLLAKARNSRAARAVFTRPLRAGFVAAGFSRHLTDEALWRTVECVRATDVDAHARRLRATFAPCLVGWSADDPLIEEAVFEELAAELPAGPRLRWAQGGHNPQKAWANELGQALVEFTQTCLAPPD